MMRRNRLALALVAALWPGLALAEVTEADCAALAGRMQALGGVYELTGARPILDGGWCRMDGASLRGVSETVPNISASGLRVRGVGMAGEMTSLELEASGVKVAPKIGDRGMADRLRSFLRMQTLDLRFRADWNREADQLELREVVVALPGKNRVALSADIKGADLSGVASLFGGAVTALDLELVTDGRVARPVMEMAGEQLLPPGASSGDAVAALREGLSGLVDAMPEAALDRESRFALTSMLAGLPQTTGRMTLALRSERGMSAAEVAVNGMRANPLHPRALATLFRGTTLAVEWQPGGAP